MAICSDVSIKNADCPSLCSCLPEGRLYFLSAEMYVQGMPRKSGSAARDFVEDQMKIPISLAPVGSWFMGHIGIDISTINQSEIEVTFTNLAIINQL